jgi:hypothetical protein
MSCSGTEAYLNRQIEVKVINQKNKRYMGGDFEDGGHVQVPGLRSRGQGKKSEVTCERGC